MQLMKPMPDLDALLEQSAVKRNGVFGTKMRSVIKSAEQRRLASAPNVDQQFEIGRRIVAARPCADHRARGRHQQPLRRPPPRPLLKSADPRANLEQARARPSS